MNPVSQNHSMEINTTRVINERLETERIDSSTDVYKSELKFWIQRAISYLFFFILLQFSNLGYFNFSYSLIPLFALDLKILLSKLLSKNSKFPLVMLNSVFVHQICSIVFKTELIMYWATKSFNPMVLLVPIIFLLFSQFLNKPEKNKSCKYLVWLIMTISELVFFFTILNFALYFQGFIEWDASGILWPVYIGLCCCGVVLIGLILFTLGSFFSWMNEEISTEEFISSLWLLFTMIGTIGSIISLCLRIESPISSNYSKYSCLVTIGFLILFICFTVAYSSNISLWWEGFFVVNNRIENIEFNLPTTQVMPTPMTFQSRISNTIKKAPKVLMRVSSSFFRPAENASLFTKRSLSLKQETEAAEITCVEHKRNASNPMKVEVFSPCSKKSSTKLCEICLDKICDAVIMECGHGGICYECSLKMWKSVGFCYLCRGSISQVLQIEMSQNSLVNVFSATRANLSENNIGNS